MSMNASLGEGGQRYARFARKVCKHTHHEWQLDLLDLFIRAVEFDVIFDLHTGRVIALDDFFRTMGNGHVDSVDAVDCR